jgi:hypothetical protein
MVVHLKAVAAVTGGGFRSDSDDAGDKNVFG